MHCELIPGSDYYLATGFNAWVIERCLSASHSGYPMVCHLKFGWGYDTVVEPLVPFRVWADWKCAIYGMA